MADIHDTIRENLTISTGNSSLDSIVNMLIITTIVPAIIAGIHEVIRLVKFVAVWAYEKLLEMKAAYNIRKSVSTTIKFSVRENENVGDSTRELYNAIIAYVNKNATQPDTNSYIEYNDRKNILKKPNNDLVIDDVTYTFKNDIYDNTKSLNEDRTIIMSSTKMTDKELHGYINKIYLDSLTSNEVDYKFIICEEKSYTSKNSVRRLYRNTNTNTFDDIYIEDKQSVLNIINKYNNSRKGIFNIILHGPPGTGKSSFIKALANHTGRDIRMCNLSNVNEISDLHSWFFPKFIRNTLIVETGYEQTVEFKDKLLIFEDFDADTDSCNKRKQDDGSDDEDSDDDKTSSRKIAKEYKSRYSLSLSDILNAFDGILVPDNVMCVFTTNHIEKIDPAFLRDGRMHLNMRLGLLSNDVLRQFITDKFGKYDIDHKDLHERLTIAQVTGAYIREPNDINKFIELLRMKVV